MSCIAFGVAHHSPEEVVTSLLRSRIVKRACDIGVLPPASRTDATFKFLFLLSTEDFVRNLKRLQGTSVKTFIFSDPISLSSFNGVRGIDYQTVDAFSFNYLPLDVTGVTKSTSVPVTRSTESFLPNLIESVKHGSLLNPLMTFIYSLASVNQSAVKIAVVSYLYHGHKTQKLIDVLSTRLTERTVDKLLRILATSVTASYAAALQTVKLLRKQRTAIVIDEIARASGTSAYELSYMLSLIDEASSYSDSFNKAKNRKIGHTNDTYKSNR